MELPFLTPESNIVLMEIIIKSKSKKESVYEPSGPSEPEVIPVSVA